MGNSESTDLGQGNSTSLFFVLCIVCTAPNHRNTPVNVWVGCHKPFPVCITGSNSKDLHTPITRSPKSSRPKLIQHFYRGFYIGSECHGSGKMHGVVPRQLERPRYSCSSRLEDGPSSNHNKHASHSQIVYQVSDIKCSSFSTLIPRRSMRKSASN